MKEIERREDGIVVALSGEELSMIISALGEAIEALEDWEFESRTGFRRDEMRRFLDEMLALFKGKRRG